jgi:hypothetical protein
MAAAKEYLGDGVYVSFDGWNAWLTTENGIETTNEICLEPEVLGALLEYVERLKRFIADQGAVIPRSWGRPVVESIARAQAAGLTAIEKAMEPDKEPA